MSKGDVGEELFATFFVIALVFIFLFSAIGVYSNFMVGQAQLYAERSASAVAERIFFDNDGQMTETECQNINTAYGSMNNTAVRITYWKSDTEYKCETRMLDARSLSVASMPVLITSNGNFYPGRIDAMVGI